jgi:hypothetical protein
LPLDAKAPPPGLEGNLPGLKAILPPSVAGLLTRRRENMARKSLRTHSTNRAPEIWQLDYAHRELHKFACELHKSLYLLGIPIGAGSKVSNQPCCGGREALRRGSLASKSGSVASKSGFAILETVARVPREWQGWRLVRRSRPSRLEPTLQFHLAEQRGVKRRAISTPDIFRGTSSSVSAVSGDNL